MIDELYVLILTRAYSGYREKYASVRLTYGDPTVIDFEDIQSKLKCLSRHHKHIGYSAESLEGGCRTESAKRNVVSSCFSGETIRTSPE